MKYFLRLLTILLSFTAVFISNAKSSEKIILNCQMTKYDVANLSDYTHYGIETVKSIIPINYILNITPQGGYYNKYEIEVTKNNSEKINFHYFTKDKSYLHTYLSFRPWKHTYFKKSKKLNVSFFMYDEAIDIWGNCVVEGSNKYTLVASQNLKNNKTKSTVEPKQNKSIEKIKRQALSKRKKKQKRKKRDGAVNKLKETQKLIELEKKLAALKKQQNEILLSKKSKSEFPLKPISINFPSTSVKRDDIAVIIGNANYKKMGKDIPNVNPAYADAEGIKQYFMKAKGIKEGNIIYLKDATGAQLLGVFGNDKSYKGKLFNYIKPNKSNVYIYYAGHGAPGKEGDAYLVPTDTDSQTIEFTGYPLSTLYSNLGKLPSKSMTVILEACFSGGSQSGSLISRASPIVIQTKKTFIPNNIKVIAAGSERQMASWEEDSSHSLFTKYFLKAMSGEGDSNKDGKVSDNELKEYLSDTMTYYARRYYGRDQKVQIYNGG